MNFCPSGVDLGGGGKEIQCTRNYMKRGPFGKGPGRAEAPVAPWLHQGTSVPCREVGRKPEQRVAAADPPDTVAVAAKVSYYCSPLDRSSGLWLRNGRSRSWDLVQALFPVPPSSAA